MLRSLSENKCSQWPTYLPELVYLYNNTDPFFTGFTPFYMMFGRQGKLPKDLELTPIPAKPVTTNTDWVRERQQRIKMAQAVAEKRMDTVQECQERQSLTSTSRR